MNQPTLGVVILGAGASSRMGRPKLLLPWRDSTVIGQILRQWRELGAAQIVVVTRPNDEALVEAVMRAEGRAGSPLPAAAQTNDGAHGVTRPTNASTHFIVNPHPERGMFSSVICAARWACWQRGISSWAIALGDQPHLQTATLRLLLELAARNADAICQPQFGDHGRHPVILPRAAFDQLRDTRAETLKDFLKLVACRSVQFVANDSGLALDLDTPEDYTRAKASI
jgi:molybdenum cofactor cytidylyltransferase